MNRHKDQIKMGSFKSSNIPLRAWTCALVRDVRQRIWRPIWRSNHAATSHLVSWLYSTLLFTVDTKLPAVGEQGCLSRHAYPLNSDQAKMPKLLSWFDICRHGISFCCQCGAGSSLGAGLEPTVDRAQLKSFIPHQLRLVRERMT